MAGVAPSLRSKNERLSEMLLKRQESRRFGLRHGSDEYTAATWRQTSFVPTASVMLDNNIKQGLIKQLD
jgi:hypothetical protein